MRHFVNRTQSVSCSALRVVVKLTAMNRMNFEWAIHQRSVALPAVFLLLWFCLFSCADEPVAELTDAAPVVGASTITSDVFVAQNAWRDGLPGLAERYALAALAAPGADTGALLSVFSVLMSVYEQSRLPEDWLRMFEANASEGVDWPLEDKAFSALRDYWYARALVHASRNDAAVEQLFTLVGQANLADTIRIPSVRLLAYALHASDQSAAALDVFRAETNAPPEITLDHARLLLHAGRAEDAVRMLDPVAMLSNQVEIAAAAVWLKAWALNDAGMQAESRKKLAELATDAKTPPDLRAQALAAMALDGDEDVQAVEWAETAVSTAESLFVRQECQMVLAVVLARSGQAEAAAVLTRDLVSAAPRSGIVADTIRQVADTLLLQGFCEIALGEYDLYVSSFSSEPAEMDVQKGRGLAFSGLGQHAEAAMAYLRTSELAVDSAEKAAALFLAAEAQYAAGFNRQALSTIEALRALSPARDLLADTSLLEAECRVAFDPDAALAAFVRTADVFSGESQAETALFRAGQLQAEQAIREGSEAGLKKAVDFYVRAANSTNTMLKVSAVIGAGLVRLHAGDYAEALVDFESVMKMKGGHGVREQAQLMRAEVLLALQRPEDAVAAALDLLKTKEHSHWRGEAVFWMGRRSFNTGDFRQAEHYFSMYIEGWPDEDRADFAFLFQTQAQFQRKLYREAIDTVMKLIARNPDDSILALAHFIHAEALTELLQFDAAVLLYDVVERTAQDDVLRLTAMARRGDCLFTLGSDNAARYVESIDAYKKVLGDPALKSLDMILQCEYKIGRSLDKAGRIQEAADYYYANVISRFEAAGQDNLSMNPSARVWYARAVLGAADVFERMEQWSAAVSMLARVAGSTAPGAEEAARRMTKIKNERLDPVGRVIPGKAN